MHFSTLFTVAALGFFSFGVAAPLSTPNAETRAIHPALPLSGRGLAAPLSAPDLKKRQDEACEDVLNDVKSVGDQLQADVTNLRNRLTRL